MNILILHDEIPDNAMPDEIDTLIEARSMQKTFNELGFVPLLLSVNSNLEKLKKSIINTNPDLVVNLVESLDGSGRKSYKIPALLEKLQIPFTGESSKAIKITTNKIATKKILLENEILTPNIIFPIDETTKIKSGKYIIKPIFEDASLGINDDSIVEIKDSIDLDKLIIDREHLSSGEYFIEEFIDGREWNLSIVNNRNRPNVLPPAEILYQDYSIDKPKILNYSAKWDKNSFVYRSTTRCFDHNSKDSELLAKMEVIALKCWKLFELKNYARVDFRVNEFGVPYVLEINANPCISPDAGLAAAAAENGTNYRSLIFLIMENSNI